MASWIGKGQYNPGDVCTNGSMGVGTSSPNARLVVQVSGNDDGIILKNNSAAAKGLLAIDASGNGYVAGYTSGAANYGNWCNRKHVPWA